MGVLWCCWSESEILSDENETRMHFHLGVKRSHITNILICGKQKVITAEQI